MARNVGALHGAYSSFSAARGAAASLVDVDGGELRIHPVALDAAPLARNRVEGEQPHVAAA